MIYGKVCAFENEFEIRLLCIGKRNLIKKCEGTTTRILPCHLFIKLLYGISAIYAKPTSGYLARSRKIECADNFRGESIGGNMQVMENVRRDKFDINTRTFTVPRFREIYISG